MGEQKKIVLADDQLTNLTIGAEVLSGTYEVFTVPSGEKLLMILKKISPDMILLDVEMPGMSGYETIKSLKGNPDTANIPVIFLTTRSDASSELEGLSLGAIDYIHKPFSPPLLLKRIEVHLLLEEQRKQLERQNIRLQNYNENLENMVRQKTQKILELQSAIMETMAGFVETRDDRMDGHIGRTYRYLKIMIDEMLSRKLYYDEASEWNIDQLILSAQLHDVGKIAVNENILRKPGKLTTDEFEDIKRHTEFSGRVIEMIREKTGNQEFLDYAKKLAVYHHEKWDGSGYPYGLTNVNIPLPARLMAIADVYDALISERPYKRPYSHAEAVKLIEEGRGTQFDPALVDLFMSVADEMNKVVDR